MSSNIGILGGCNLRNALDAARGMGCSVEPIHRTGELMVRHPSQKTCVRLNGRRKDAPRSVIAFLRRIKRGE